jgi:hypothetical protein
VRPVENYVHNSQMLIYPAAQSKQGTGRRFHRQQHSGLFRNANDGVMIWSGIGGRESSPVVYMENTENYMKGLLAVLVTAIAVLGTVNVNARDDRNMWSINEALNTEDAKQKLNKGISFYFGDQSHPKILKNYGEFMSNKKTNAFNKTDEKACQWNFLSAMMSFQERAQRMGGNAVVNIRSYYKKNTISSQTEFECGSGAFVSGVTFLGDVVTVAK